MVEALSIDKEFEFEAKDAGADIKETEENKQHVIMAQTEKVRSEQLLLLNDATQAAASGCSMVLKNTGDCI